MIGIRPLNDAGTTCARELLTNASSKGFDGAQQVGVKQVAFENQGTTTNHDILATINATGSKYIESGAGCLGEGPGKERADGTYKGTTTVKGFLDTGGAKGA